MNSAHTKRPMWSWLIGPNPGTFEQGSSVALGKDATTAARSRLKANRHDYLAVTSGTTWHVQLVFGVSPTVGRETIEHVGSEIVPGVEGEMPVSRVRSAWSVAPPTPSMLPSSCAARTLSLRGRHREKE